MAYGTIKVDTIENTNGLTGNAIGPGFKNRIINGAMVIDQRNAGAAVTGLTGGQYVVDRWTAFQNYGTVTTQQSTTAPTGFVNSLYTTVTSTASVSTNSIYSLVQSIEGINIADLGFGTASAKTITISFQVRSSVTGTYGIFIRNSAADRFYTSTFSISSANTWESKSITLTGDTGGTWLTSTGIGLTFGVVLGAGATRQGTANTWTASSSGPYTTSAQVDWMSNANATFYITGVQLEVGPSATSFDYRPYGTELALCQRYYEKIGRSGDIYNLPIGYCYQSGGVNYLYWYGVPLLVEKRTTPTISFSSSGGTSFFHGIYGTSDTAATLDATMTGNVTAVVQSARAVSFYQPTNSTTGANAGSALLAALKNGQYVFVSAEL